MTASAVPDTSNRGRPSSLAGTTCRPDTSRISPSALQSAIRCRTDRSGGAQRLSHPLARQLRPKATQFRPESSPNGHRTPRNLLTTCPLEPFPGFPVGGKRAFPSLTVSAPNSSQEYNSLQNRRDRRSARRPRRPPVFHQDRPTHRGDVSPPPRLRGCTFRDSRSRSNDPNTPTSCTPTSSAIRRSFCH